MITELIALEDKVTQVSSLCRALRAENAQLRQQLATAEGENRKLAERMESACARIESLAEQLPEIKVTA